MRYQNGFVPKKKTNTHNNSFDSIENDENIKKGYMGEDNMIDKLEISDVSSDSFNSEEEEEEEIPELEGISEANEEDEFSSIRGGSRSRNQSHKREKGKSTSKFKPPSLSESLASKSVLAMRTGYALLPER